MIMELLRLLLYFSPSASAYTSVTKGDVDPPEPIFFRECHLLPPISTPHDASQVEYLFRMYIARSCSIKRHPRPIFTPGSSPATTRRRIVSLCAPRNCAASTILNVRVDAVVVWMLTSLACIFILLVNAQKSHQCACFDYLC